MFRERTFIGCSFLLAPRHGDRLVGTWIQRHQLDVEISEDFERAEEPRLIRYPPDQGRSSLVDVADFETLNGRDKGRAQCALDLYLVRPCAHFDSFLLHDDSAPRGHVGNHSTRVRLDRCETCDRHWPHHRFLAALAHHPNRVITTGSPGQGAAHGITMAVAGLQVAHWRSGPREGVVKQG